MATHRKKQITLFIAVLIISVNVSAQTLSPDNWTNYTGWHYGGSSLPAWGGWAREFAKDQTGLNLLDTTTMRLDTVLLNNLYNRLALLDTTVDVMELDGGLGSARDTGRVKFFMRMIESDSGRFWKDLVYKQCYRLARLPNSKDRLYYQLGNEISSPAYSGTIRYWRGQPYINGFNYDQFIIPYFVEYFIAPTIEAIDSASLAYFGQRGMINIAMGSITNAHNPNAKVFLDSVLNYTITGTYAPSLAGKKVYELIHIITIHYMMGTATTHQWLTTINSFASWFGRGRVRGVWSTEEVGIKAATLGAGASAGATTTCRYLKWSIDNNYAARTARTNYFGWNTGPPNTKVNDLNSELFSFLGKAKLQYVDSFQTSYANPSNLEWYGFLNNTLNKGILVTLLAKTNPATPQQNISQIKFARVGWGNISSVTITRYDTLGNSNIPASLSFSTDSVTVTFSSQNLYRESVLLLKINTQPLIVGVDAGREKTEAPLRFKLEQNYPNPFNPTTKISYQIPVASHVTLKVYNLLGREVATLVDEYMNAGTYSIEFGVRSVEVASGLYFYQIKSGSFIQTKKMLVLK